MARPGQRSLLFDIETGGFEANKSPVLSLSYSHAGNISSYYAHSPSGSFISAWANKNVVGQIAQLKNIGKISEQEVLETFLNRLETLPAGSTVAGWNIGYKISPQSPWAGGFDIPFLMSRANKYNLFDRYQAAFSKLRVRDIGREFLTSAALRVYKHASGLPEEQLAKTIDPELWKQIKPYGRQALELQRGGATIRQISEQLSYMQVHGWKQELAYEMMTGKKAAGAHLSHADVGALVELTNKGWRGSNEEFVGTWNRLALQQRLAGAAKAAYGRGQEIPWANLEKRASAFGLDFAGIKSTVLEEITEGKAAAVTGKSRQILKFAAEHKLAIGGGVVAAALIGAYIAKPLSRFYETKEEKAARRGEIVGLSFSGRGDAYNTIPGLPERGMAADIRHQMTPFGSGYGPRRELTDQEKETIRQFQFFTEALSKYGKKIGTAHKRIIIPKEVIDEKELTETLGFVPVRIAVPESGQTSWTSWRDPSGRYHVHEHDKMWVMHRDRHEAMTMMGIAKERRTGKAPTLLEKIGYFFTGLPHVVTEGVPGVYFYLKGLAVDSDKTLQRLWSALPSTYKKTVDRFINDEYVSSLVSSGSKNAHNTIPGMPERGMAADIRHQMTPFGSGYNREEEKPSSNFLVFPVMAGGAIGGYTLMYPWGNRQDWERYERLTRMRKAAEKGFVTVSSEVEKLFQWKESWRDIFSRGIRGVPGGLVDFLSFGEGLRARRDIRSLSGFEGLVWVRDVVLSKRKIKKFLHKAELTGTPLHPSPYWGNKLDIWEHLQSKGKTSLHAETLGAVEFFGAKGPTSKGEAFFEKFGENVVLKKVNSARGVGVWLDLEKVPDELFQEMSRHPKKYIFQEKLDIAEEFRVTTVGDYPVHTTYRFGSPRVREIAKKFGFQPTKESLEKIQKISPFEVVQPVIEPQLRARVEEFATKMAREMPFEISAFDIALLKSGEFKLVEAQEVFGNTSNPLVASRIRHILTGKPGYLGLAAAIGGAAIAAGIYSLFSDKDKSDSLASSTNLDHNSIKGMPERGMAADIRHQMTLFGSGWLGKVLKRIRYWYEWGASKIFGIGSASPRVALVHEDFLPNFYSGMTSISRKGSWNLGREQLANMSEGQYRIFLKKRGIEFRHGGNVQGYFTAADVGPLRQAKETAAGRLGVAMKMARADLDTLRIADGMAHGGMSESIRHTRTPFGGAISWIKSLFGTRFAKEGIVVVPRKLATFHQHVLDRRLGGAAAASIRRDLLGDYVQDVRSQIVFEGRNINKYERSIRLLEKRVGLAKATGLHEIAVGGRKELFSGLLKHERFHQMIAEIGLRGDLANVPIPREAEKFFSLSLAYRDSPEMWSEEFFAYASQVAGTPLEFSKFVAGVSAVKRLPKVTPMQYLKMSQSAKEGVEAAFRRELGLTSSMKHNLAKSTVTAQAVQFNAAKYGAKGHIRKS